MAKFEFKVTINDPFSGALKNELACIFYDDADEHQDSKFTLINATNIEANFSYELPSDYTEQDAADYVGYLLSDWLYQFSIENVKQINA